MEDLKEGGDRYKNVRTVLLDLAGSLRAFEANLESALAPAAAIPGLALLRRRRFVLIPDYLLFNTAERLRTLGAGHA